MISRDLACNVSRGMTVRISHSTCIKRSKGHKKIATTIHRRRLYSCDETVCSDFMHRHIPCLLRQLVSDVEQVRSSSAGGATETIGVSNRGLLNEERFITVRLSTHPLSAT